MQYGRRLTIDAVQRYVYAMNACDINQGERVQMTPPPEEEAHRVDEAVKTTRHIAALNCVTRLAEDSNSQSRRQKRLNHHSPSPDAARG